MVDESSISETAYHCTATWHLAQMTRAAEMIYSLACVISKSSHQFFCSAPNLAHYLGYERRQIYRGLQELEDTGFLELISRLSFQSSVYRVVLHKDWAAKHPGRCATKQAFPWAGEGDELGRKLYALSGGRHRFLEYQIKLLRKVGIPEELVLTEWEDFLGRWRPLNRQDARYAFSRFYDLLKAKHGDPNPLEMLIYQLYQISGYFFSGVYKMDLSWMIGRFPEAEIIERFGVHLENGSDTKRAVRSFCDECRQEQVSQFRVAMNTAKPAPVKGVSSEAGC